jgi:hypothetical protein
MAPICSYDGCSKPRVKDRMFCSEHLESYPVSNVPTFRKRQGTTDSEPEPRPNRDDDDTQED